MMRVGIIFALFTVSFVCSVDVNAVGAAAAAAGNEALVASLSLAANEVANEFAGESASQQQQQQQNQMQQQQMQQVMVANGWEVQTAEVGQQTNQHDVVIPVNGGWTKFFFGGKGTHTAYRLVVDAKEDDYTKIAITDAYCPGDSFNLIKNDEDYLLTSVRTDKPVSVQCNVSDPDVALLDPKYSSAIFMLRGAVNLSIDVLDSPYGGGAAFIRADSHVEKCDHGLFSLVTAPLFGGRQAIEKMCQLIGKKPAHIKPDNVEAAVEAIGQCQHDGKLVWFGQLSLMAAQKAYAEAGLGCLAFDVSNVQDPTVAIVECDMSLGYLCA